MKALRMGFLSKHMAVIVMLLLLVLSSLLVPNFFSEVNLKSILFQYSIIGFLVLGQLCVMLTGGIDLSQGSMLALTSILTAVVYNAAGLAVAVICGILLPVLLGAFNGLLASRTKMPPFIITLGMLSIARALAMMIANAKPVPIKDELFGHLATFTVLYVPLCALLWLATGVILHYVLTQRRFGRYVFSVGSSEASTLLSGVNVVRIKQSVYVLSGFLTAIGGLIWTSRLGSGSPIGGSGYEMEAIASVVIGGGSLMGGVGSVPGAMAGALIFGIINSVLNLIGISPYLQGTLKGVIILLAVVAVQTNKKGK
jgi:ribose transport system permease protein